MGAALAGLLPWRLWAILLTVAVVAIWRVQVHVWLLIGAVLVGSLSMGVREYSLAHSFAQQMIRSHSAATFQAVVRSDPTVIAPKVIGSNRRQGGESFLAVSTEITGGGGTSNVHLPLRILLSSTQKFIPGEIIAGSGRLIATSEKKVAALLIVKGSVRSIRRAPLVQRAAWRIRNKFAAQCSRIFGNAGALIPGLVLGDTSLESPTLIAQMRRSGLTHLTAVSGENFAIISSFLLSYLSWLIRSLRLRIFVVALVLAGFIEIVRPSPSVLRAAVMSGVLLIAHARGQRHSALPALGLAIALLLLINPFLAIDPGFALSVSATAGILLLQKPLDERLVSIVRVARWRELIVIPLAATIFCLPIIVAISGQISPLSIPANILASLAVAPVTIIGFLAALVATISPPLAHLLLVPLGPISGWISWVAATFSHFPVIQLPHSYLGAFVILLALLLRRWWRRLFLALTLLLLATSWISSAWPGSNWLMAVCDVGQGDGFAIHLAKDQALVIDSGPDPRLMDSCLSLLGVRDIPLAILTHFHADHVGGVSALTNHRTLHAYWISSDHQPTSEYQSVLQALAPVVPIEVSAGERFTIGSQYGPVIIEILSPEAGTGNSLVHQTGSDINNSSIAAIITIAGLRIFAAGDIEPQRQAEILATYRGGPVDILKVAHHGSSHQDPELEKLLRPKVAVISVGLGNPYGHPSPATIARLHNLGARTFRTDLDGAISIDSSLRIRTIKSGSKRDWWKISWG